LLRSGHGNARIDGEPRVHSFPNLSLFGDLLGDLGWASKESYFQSSRDNWLDGHVETSWWFKKVLPNQTIATLWTPHPCNLLFSLVCSHIFMLILVTFGLSNGKKDESTYWFQKSGLSFEISKRYPRCVNEPPFREGEYVARGCRDNGF
jgi:hypothetical protein